MQGFYHSIETQRLNQKPVLTATSKHSTATLNSPAIELMEDFSRTKPINLSEQTLYEKIREILFDTDSDFAFITNQQKQITGMIPIEDLIGLRSMVRAHEFNLKIKELNARDLMTPVNEIPSIPIDVIQRSKVGDILHTFKQLADEYILVTENEPSSIRGLFCARALNSALGLASESRFQARSVSDIAQIINGHYSRA